MDWIEEKVEKLLNRMKNADLYKSLLYTVLIWFVVAFGSYIVTKNICSSWIEVMKERYAILNQIFVFWETMHIRGIPFLIKVLYIGLNLLYQYGIFFYIVVAEMIGIYLFFKRKINPGMEAVEKAIAYMKLGDLSHEQTYFSKDEMGKICDEVEELRKNRIATKQGEWHLQAEQREINAVFAHDIRTPLTVMKGYTEFLLKYYVMGKVSEEMLLEKLNIMLQQEERLLEFSKTMTKIQNIDMRELNCRQISLADMHLKIKNTTEMLEKQTDKELKVVSIAKEELEVTKMMVDESLIMEVCENLISNALRYAKKQVEVKMMRKDKEFIIFVQDDGEGFSTMALKKAKKVYWSEAKESDSHFGMGLYMCEKLCEKHGGKLSITNAIDGGAISAAEFKIGY